jgi:SAM-dependent methyltransferase
VRRDAEPAPGAPHSPRDSILPGVAAPLPPIDLRERVGQTPPGEDPEEFYLAAGARHRQRIEGLIPVRGRALDFGCGAGRTIRHFVPDAEAGRLELWGCDIAEPSIDWLRENMSPPLNVFVTTEEPGLPQPDDFFHAIWGLSVFTHITGAWAGWLLELHRVLADDGHLLLTFLNEGMAPLWRELSGTDWDPDRVGMATFRENESWDLGGPIVFLSEWWLRAHWGRAFEIEHLETRGFGQGDHGAQGYVVLRKRPGTFTTDDLTRPEPGERREALAEDWARRRRSTWRRARRRLGRSLARR